MDGWLLIFLVVVAVVLTLVVLELHLDLRSVHKRIAEERFRFLCLVKLLHEQLHGVDPDCELRQVRWELEGLFADMLLQDKEDEDAA
ncbi:MAG: hypothetical protein HZC42_06875 [Candidatus Eisenbacteria bacterium]|nr:hypothetical protein [Candidatus Eisenbacteria bacterium]